MSNNHIKVEFKKQIHLGKALLKEKRYKNAFYHFENAHILGQNHIVRHTISHYWMFIIGIKSKNGREIIGQFIRIIASLLFTLVWVPKGNSGGANISPIKIMPIRKELKKYF
ncbi:DUF3703 domain-containing protein [uncultured Polaribacter sp.]|uniref:DUF3703 domain-containing protein n=1 Tax=uncultured Polaribacter sp. TaxID=174711 RepID=UPI0026050EBD|nr:DUF3703 domain-containing protein [uncultured Polaribacter sp.]